MGAMIEPGFVAIPNQTFDWLLKQTSKLTKREIAVLLAVFRNTVGYRRKKARMSCRYIEEATGINYRHVSETIKKLDGRYIRVEKTTRSNLIEILTPEEVAVTETVTPDRKETVTETVTELLPNRQQNCYQNGDKYKQNTNRNTNKKEEETDDWMF